MLQDWAQSDIEGTLRWGKEECLTTTETPYKAKAEWMKQSKLRGAISQYGKEKQTVHTAAQKDNKERHTPSKHWPRKLEMKILTRAL